MARYIFLDSEPLGLASQASGKPRPDQCRAWLDTVETAGARVIIPEIVDYEVRRELVRVGATAGIRRLNGLLARFTLLPLERAALLRAAELWALLRRAGVPTADPHALDAMRSLPDKPSPPSVPGSSRRSPPGMYGTWRGSRTSTRGSGHRSIEEAKISKSVPNRWRRGVEVEVTTLLVAVGQGREARPRSLTARARGASGRIPGASGGCGCSSRS